MEIENPRVLLAIDDMQDNLVALKAVIADAFPGTKTLTALDGGEGIALARAENPDVILLDAVMPGMDGFEVCRQLKSDPRLCDIPVVFLTAMRSDRINRFRALEAGAEAFLSKPIDDVELVAQIHAMTKIRAAVERQRMEKERLAALVAERTAELELELAAHRDSERELHQANRELREGRAALLRLTQDLTEEIGVRKKAEEALGESERHLRKITDTVPARVARVDRDFRYLMVNGEYKKWFHKDTSEVVGRHVSDLIGNVRWEKLRPFAERALEGQQVEFESEEEFADLGRRWIRRHYSPERDENGLVVGFVSLVTDITATKQLEHQLREHQVRLDDALHSAAMGAWHWDIATGKRHFDDQVCRLMGFDPGKFRGTAGEFLGAVHPDDRATVTGALKHAVEHRTVYEPEYRVVWPDGSVRHIAARGRVVQDDAGAPVRVIGLAWDITERIRAHEALRESETRYRVLAETAADAIITADSEGRIAGWNRAAERMFGHAPERIIGQHLTALMPERYRDAHVHGLHRAAGRDTRGVRTQAVELQGLTRDGREIPVELSLSRWNTPRGTFFTAVVRDITERKQLQEAHLQAQKLESLGTLAGGIAHDFNNILAAIRGNADLAAKDVGPDHISTQSLEEIRKASARASELVRRITTFASPKEARIEEVDLRAVVAEVLKLLRSTLPAAIALSTEFGEDTPWVLADAGQVHEATVNLTTNAAHAIGPRPGSIEYRLETLDIGPDESRNIPGLRQGRYACLTVTDSGCGMDAATMERIFDAFYTTKPLGEGTGLGLSMVHGIMKAHGGAVTVESTLGKGSSFRLYFPAARGTLRKPVTKAPKQTALIPGQRVLYVDDEEALVFLAQRVLSRLGHSIRGFTDPKQALAAFRAAPEDFDIVVTDLSMPHMSGIDFAREVLAVRPHMPVLMTTGHIREEDESNARKAGVRELVLKPFTVDELGRIFDQLFRGIRSESEESAG